MVNDLTTQKGAMMHNQHVIITGASRGIGRALATEFAKAGYDLTITCVRSEEKLKELASELTEKYNVTCSTFIGDLSDPSSIERLFEGIDDVDVLINNGEYPTWDSFMKCPMMTGTA